MKKIKGVFQLAERIQKLEERIEKRREKVEKLQSSLKDEKSKLAKDEETLLHLKYNDVLKRMQETGVSPDEALRAIDNGYDKSQTERNEGNPEGGSSHGNNY